MKFALIKKDLMNHFGKDYYEKFVDIMEKLEHLTQTVDGGTTNSYLLYKHPEAQRDYVIKSINDAKNQIKEIEKLLDILKNLVK